jgi:hypothetical protein
MKRRVVSRVWSLCSASRSGSGVVVAVLALIVPSVARGDPPSLLDRAVVAAAMRRAVERSGLGSNATRDLATRARAAGWVPQLSVRVRRGTGASATETYQPTGSAMLSDSFLLDVRLTFALDRVVFDPSEVAIARVEIERSERRARIELEVVEVLAAMEQARAELRAHEPESPEAARANLAFARSRARLEAMTGTSLSDLLRAR